MNRSNQREKRGDSTKSTLIRVKNVMIAVNGNNPVVLVILELSAACDTIAYTILFDRLENMFVSSGSVLQRFRSYLTSRSVMIHEGIRARSVFLRVPCSALDIHHVYEANWCYCSKTSC